MNPRKFFFPLLLGFMVVFLISCGGGSALRYDELGAVTVKEDYLSAISSIKKKAKKLYGKKNRLLYRLDLGMLYHYAGMYDSSNNHLLAANDIFNDLFARSVSNEAAAFMVNDNVRPYRSRPYELVLLHQTIALNFLAQGNVESALVETRQVDLLMQELDRKDKSGVKYFTDGMFHYLASLAYDAAGQNDEAMISLFKAVAAYKRGPVALPPGFREYAYCMLIKNDRVGDIALLEKTTSQDSIDLANPQKWCLSEPDAYRNGATEIVLVGYAGRGPRLTENKWWGTYVKDGLLIMNYKGVNGAMETMQMSAPMLPPAEYQKAAKGQKTASGTTFHLSFALPEVKTALSKTAFFTITGAGAPAPETTMVVNDLDLQARKNLEDSRTATLGRTAVRVVIRTIAAQTAKEGMKTDSPLANLLLNLSTDILADQLENADTRGCFMIPRTMQIARIRVSPGTHTLEAQARDASGAVLGTKVFENVTVGQGEKKFLFYSSFK